MLPIARPEFTVEEVFTACISDVKNQAHKVILENCMDALIEAEQEYDERFPAHTIHEIVSNEIVNVAIPSDEFLKVYTYRMVNKARPGRAYYDKILISAPHGKCPLCSVRDADTIDHYMKKAVFPIYAVTPCTLIPACTPCNKYKKIEIPTGSNDQTLNPYYDNINDVEWIGGTLIRTEPVTFNFSVIPYHLWDDVLVARVQNHFIAFNLNEAYSSHANEEFRGIRRHLKNLYSLDPTEMIRHLEQSLDSRLDLGINSWQAVMYRTLLNDNWFLTGGVIE